MITKNCKVCGKEFNICQSLVDKRFTCSRRCRGLSQINGKSVPCNNCGKLVYRNKGLLKNSGLIFCSRLCSTSSILLRDKISKAHKGISFEERFGKIKAEEMKKNISIKNTGRIIEKKGVYRNCRICNKYFYVYPSDDRKHNKKVEYCSKKCVDKSKIGKPAWNKGIPHTEEHKKKLKEAKEEEKERPWRKTGKFVQCVSCGKSIYRCKAHLDAQRNHYCSKDCRMEYHVKNPLRNCNKSDVINAFSNEKLTVKEICKKLSCDKETVITVLSEGGISKEQRLLLANKKIGTNTKKHRKYQILPMKDSSIEIKIQELLSILHIEFETHKYISEIKHSYQCDILIPKQKGINKKTIIECDGCFWHCCPICKPKEYQWTIERRELDAIRNSELKEKGFRVIRLWEHDIKSMDSIDLEKALQIK